MKSLQSADGARRRLARCAAVGALMVVVNSASAGLIIEPGTYRLQDHPDGALVPPLYGLRLDELIDLNPGQPDRFTFSFDEPGAEMWLTLGEDTSIHIFGTVYGGRDIGPGWEDPGFWEVDFTYAMSKGADPDDDIIVNPGDQNMGTITRLMDNMTFDLFDFEGGNPYTFRLGDEDDDLGHRGFPGISGWGWINHGDPDIHTPVADWLFTLTVPAPPAAVLLGVALLAGPRRRRS